MTYVGPSALPASLDRDAAGHTAHLKAVRRRSSLVDHVSFEVMRRRGLEAALALDADFAAAGFRVVP